MHSAQPWPPCRAPPCAGSAVVCICSFPLTVVPSHLCFLELLGEPVCRGGAPKPTLSCPVLGRAPLAQPRKQLLTGVRPLGGRGDSRGPAGSEEQRPRTHMPLVWVLSQAWGQKGRSVSLASFLRTEAPRGGRGEDKMGREARSLQPRSPLGGGDRGLSNKGLQGLRS